MAQAARRRRGQGRAASRGHHRQGQRGGSVAVRGRAAKDPGRRGADGSAYGRDCGDRGSGDAGLGRGHSPWSGHCRREGGGSRGRRRGSEPGRAGRAGNSCHSCRYRHSRRPTPGSASFGGRRPERAHDAGRADADAPVQPLAGADRGYGPCRPDHSRRRDYLCRARRHGEWSRHSRFGHGAGEPPLPPSPRRGRESPLRPTRPPSSRTPFGHPCPASRAMRRAWLRARLHHRRPPTALPGNRTRTRFSSRTARCVAALPPR